MEEAIRGINQRLDEIEKKLDRILEKLPYYITTTYSATYPPNLEDPAFMGVIDGDQSDP